MDRAEEKILSRFDSLDVNGTPIDVICSNYGNRVFLLVTSLNKVGTLVSCLCLPFITRIIWAMSPARNYTRLATSSNRRHLHGEDFIRERRRKNHSVV